VPSVACQSLCRAVAPSSTYVLRRTTYPRLTRASCRGTFCIGYRYSSDTSSLESHDWQDILATLEHCSEIVLTTVYFLESRRKS
jgi:hypothetical protein